MWTPYRKLSSHDISERQLEPIRTEGWGTRRNQRLAYESKREKIDRLESEKQRQLGMVKDLMWSLHPKQMEELQSNKETKGTFCYPLPQAPRANQDVIENTKSREEFTRILRGIDQALKRSKGIID